MAYLVFVNGKKLKVDYNRAAKVFQILLGSKEIEPDSPDEFETREAFLASDEYKKKEAFLTTVKEVEFDDHKFSQAKPWEKWKKGGSSNDS